MVNTGADVHKSRKSLILVAVTIAMAGSGIFLLRNDEQGDITRSNSQVVVVPARADGVQHPQLANADAGQAKPLPVMLDATGASRLVAEHLPALRAVRSECDADVCTVSGEPSAGGAPLDDMAFSQLVHDDMPAILARTGHGLTEAIQIEEPGPGQYRLRFRIARQAR